MSDVPIARARARYGVEKLRLFERAAEDAMRPLIRQIVVQCLEPTIRRPSHPLRLGG